MAIGPGSRIGPYEVTSLIGEGGMGKVWRAHHAALKRDDALKVLPDAFASDPDRLARFQREAQVLASLNHPNIAHVYGLEQAYGVQALVMELIEGPTLADRIAQGPIPLDDALPMAKQVAEALEAAHEQGIIHRDLKPANIKLRPDGTVKVLDFGLAKALEPMGAMSPSISQSPTITSPAMMTGAGVLLGTAAYMSPEQAKGRPADRRSDIWAFGCVLFELLTGRRAFKGDDVSDTLVAVLRDEPPWDALPSGTPHSIRKLLRRCMEKDRRRRLDSAADARLEIEDALTTPMTDPRAAPRARGALRWIIEAVVATVLIALAIPLAWYVREVPPPAGSAMRTSIVTPATGDPFSFALSPDGRQLAFVASGGGPSRLWLRSMAATSAQPLPGTEGAASPFWSPDSRSVGFFADGRLKWLDIDGGTPHLLTTAVPRGGTWNSDGVILFSQTTGSPVFRVSAAGGEAVAVTKLDQQGSHRWPTFLPDGRHFLYFALGTPEKTGIYLASLEAEEPTRLTASDTGAFYAPSGWLLWVRGGALLAQPLDLDRRALVGDSVTVADIAMDTATGAPAFSVSSTGLVAYRTAGATTRQLRWFDSAGKQLEVLGAPDESGITFPRLSPDGRRAAVSRAVEGNSDIWLLDGTRATRFTFDTAIDRLPVWAPDGRRIVFDSNREGARNLYLGVVDSPGGEIRLLESQQDVIPSDWSRDGRFILYTRRDPQTDWDLWILPLEGTRKPCLFLQTSFGERNGQLSPDGSWVAYMSNQSGPTHVFVRPFFTPRAASDGNCGTTTNPVAQWQISTSSGIYPKWRPDGKALFYIGPNGQMMATPVMATGDAFEAGTPVALFETQIFGGGADNQQGWQYDVTRDGRFLINTVVDDSTVPITLLQNWTPSATK